MRLSSIAMRIDRNEIWNNISVLFEKYICIPSECFFPIKSSWARWSSKSEFFRIEPSQIFANVIHINFTAELVNECAPPSFPCTALYSIGGRKKMSFRISPCMHVRQFNAVQCSLFSLKLRRWRIVFSHIYSLHALVHGLYSFNKIESDSRHRFIYISTSSLLPTHSARIKCLFFLPRDTQTAIDILQRSVAHACKKNVMLWEHYGKEVLRN